jgi:hypothetical protein
MDKKTLDYSDIALAAETAHYAFGTLRRVLKKSNLSDEARKLLHALADAAHNLPLMTSPDKNQIWTTEDIKRDVLECQNLMTKINAMQL